MVVTSYALVEALLTLKKQWERSDQELEAAKAEVTRLEQEKADKAAAANDILQFSDQVGTPNTADPERTRRTGRGRGRGRGSGSAGGHGQWRKRGRGEKEEESVILDHLDDGLESIKEALDSEEWPEPEQVNLLTRIKDVATNCRDTAIRVLNKADELLTASAVEPEQIPTK